MSLGRFSQDRILQILQNNANHGGIGANCTAYCTNNTLNGHRNI